MSSFLRRCTVILTAVFFVFSVHAEEPSCAFLAPAKKIVSELRELPFRKNVQCVALTPKDFKEVFLNRIRPQINLKKIKAEEKVYKLLGFIPQDFNYSDCVLESYFSETGAFYREDSDDFVIRKTGSLLMSRAVHELTHALQNQHFNLKTFSNVKTETTDALMAKFALIEGDATSIEQQVPEEAPHTSIPQRRKKICFTAKASVSFTDSA